jgi:hypothetical protein
MNAMRPIVAICIGGLFSFSIARSGELPANKWFRLVEEDTGARQWPAFWYDPGLKRFLLSAGVCRKQRHYDTEAFNVTTRKWSNLYPSGSPYKVVSGPTDARGVRFPIGQPLKTDAAGVMRILRGLNPYRCDPGIFFQYARSTKDGYLYAHLLEKTIRFDPGTRQWSDLKANRFSKAGNPVRKSWLIYGSLAYDPVNKEILSVGGTSDEDGGTPGTWCYSITANRWKKLSPGSAQLKALNAEAGRLHVRAAAFINACRNRFYLTESEVEAKTNLAAGANDLAAAAEKLAAKLRSTELTGLESAAPGVALKAIERVGAGFKTIAGKLSGRFGGKTLVDAQILQDSLLATERALDPEPCGRAVSQMATCPKLGKIVLFGGCTFDGFLADTWIYDCRTRTWEQRYPKICPAPRGGHVLAWLPKSEKVVLFGSKKFTNSYRIPHQKPAAPRDLWTYDVETNEWKLLAGATKDGPTYGVGAVNDDDLLVVVGRKAKKSDVRITWGLQVDPKASDAGSAAAGVAPGSVSLVFEGPADYDGVAKPDPDVITKFLKGISHNQWTPMPAPPRKSNPRGWGTRPYDTVRHQFITFGGGHGEQHYTDVGHYSMRTATWSTGYAEEFPFVNSPFSAMFSQTFRNRPTVGHVFDAADFDPVSGKVVWFWKGVTWVYDPARREWEYPPGPTPTGHWNSLKHALVSTPRGVVCWAQGDLMLFDAKAGRWSKLPIQRGKVGGAYGDSGGICHDSRRDCLWLSHGGSPVLRYDMKTGAVETHSTPAKPERIWMRETVYVPELDVLLNAGRIDGPHGAIGNLAYDIAKKKWTVLVMPCSDGKPRVNDKPYSQIDLGLAYDPGLKVAVFYYQRAQEILVARLTTAGLKKFEPRIQQNKRKK